MLIRIVNWREYQHYHKRRIRWVKLYCRLLEHRNYRQLSAGAKVLLIDLWLLAGETHDGALSFEDAEELAWRLRGNAALVAANLKEIENQTNEEGHPQWIVVDQDVTAASGSLMAGSLRPKLRKIDGGKK